MDYKTLAGGFLMGSLATYLAFKVFKDSNLTVSKEKKPKDVPIHPEFYSNDR